MNTEKFASRIIKQADLVDELGKLLKVGIDDEAIEYGMETLRILDSIELKAESVIDKNEINDVRAGIREIMEKIQDCHNKLFIMQQRLIHEEDPRLKDIE